LFLVIECFLIANVAMVHRVVQDFCCKPYDWLAHGLRLMVRGLAGFAIRAAWSAFFFGRTKKNAWQETAC
jgi:hypothetical protein